MLKKVSWLVALKRAWLLGFLAASYLYEGRYDRYAKLRDDFLAIKTTRKLKP